MGIVMTIFVAGRCAEVLSYLLYRLVGDLGFF
jgi:hypothetical protein